MALVNWEFDGVHSMVGFTVRHMVIAKVHGRFSRWSGSFVFDGENMEGARVDIRINAASIDTGVADRDAHLRSPDFLDVEKFPELHYVSRRVERLGERRGRAVGDLTIRGVTREVALDVEYEGRAKDLSGKERAGFAARTSFDRKDFGLKWNQVLEAGGLLVGDRVDVVIEVEAVRAV